MLNRGFGICRNLFQKGLKMDGKSLDQWLSKKFGGIFEPTDPLVTGRLNVESQFIFTGFSRRP